MTYADHAAALPAPTAEQTREFARYVTGAHSWYKHLPVHPPVPFVFYLDPNSGRSMVHVSENEVAFVDNVDEKDAFHYTWQKTEAYRRRFGFWNYHAPYGKSLMYSSEGTTFDTGGTGLTVLFEGAGWLEVPKRLALAGTALVSALVWTMRGLEAQVAAEESADSIVRTLEFYARSRGEVDAYASLLPPDMAAAVRNLAALWESEGYRGERKATHSELEGTPSSSPNWDATYERAKAAWERTESCRRDKALRAPIAEALGREIERQVGGMVCAMNQFLEALRAA